MKKFEVQTPLEFLQSFIYYATNAEKNIWIQTMNFDPGVYVDEIVELLLRAAQKGIDVQIEVDWLAERFYNGRFDPLYLKKNSHVESFNKKRQEMYKRLISSGVKLTVTNKPSAFNLLNLIFPAYRRNHIKMFIVDNRVAWMGGVNLMDYAFHNLDLMVKITDPNIVQALVHQFPRVNYLRSKRNYAVNLTEDSIFLVDSGRLGKSLIYKKATDVVKDAQETVIFISQFLPDGEMLKKLITKSLQNVKVIIITSNQSDEVFTSFPRNILYNRFLQKIKNNPCIQFIHFPNKVHIKLLLVDYKIAIFGSHNFSNLGGVLGTEEIAICSTNKELITDFKKYLVQNAGVLFP